MRWTLNVLACAAVALLGGFGSSQRAWMLQAPSPARAAFAASALHTNPGSASVSELLRRYFPSTDLSYLLFDFGTNSVVAERWPGSDRPIPVGSLVKPFTAIAYAESHAYRFPEHECTAGACWLPRGHGKVNIVRAVALSCNSYFGSLAENVTPSQVSEVARRFGLSGPPADVTAAGLAGRNGAWLEPPQALVRGYAELLGRSSQPGIADVVEGMRESAKDGTAAAIERAVPRIPVLAKTGTAPCTHRPHAPGDGFVIAAWPAHSPRYLLLIRQHGRPGALAAISAGKMMREIEALR